MGVETRATSVRQFFSPRGPLAQRHPQYEFRRGQIEMAEAVEAALRDRRHLIVEAGTGTGKTLAYLAPAILSGCRIVVSTGTKNLQEQLFYKDIPFLEGLFGRKLNVCYMKGRANYACRQKIYDAERQAVLEGLEEVADFQIIRAWEAVTEFGDRAEIRQLPEDSTAWAKVDARRDLCAGQKCPQFERCFLTLMQRRAHESDIIIVNHHLFFADLALKDEDFGGILPECRAVVFDEAHELEDVAGQYFGVSLSNLQIQDLWRDIARISRIRNFGSPELDLAIDTLGQATEALFAALPQGEGRAGFSGREAFLKRHRGKYRAVAEALELTAAVLRLVEQAPEELIPLVRRAGELEQKLHFLFQETDTRFVYWMERRGRGCYLQATPIDVSAILAERLFGQMDTVVLTSATLAVAGSFEFVQRRLGLEGARALIAPDNFDYARQALLYVPQHLPDPRDPGFLAAAAEEVIRLLRHSQGRAFVLFTSYQQMRAMHDRIAFALDYPTLLQGTGPRSALLEEFRSTPHAVLFATASFWQGVDVPGDQLSCVIIDRLPFAVPSDPVVEARIRLIREKQGNPFYEYQIPQAAIALKQGFGRLIRSKTDRGVLVLLDNRITRQRYGQVFFDSLPAYRFTTDIEEVERFFHV